MKGFCKWFQVRNQFLECQNPLFFPMELMFDSECFEKSCKYSLLRFFFYTPPFVKYVKECEFSNNLKWKFNKTMMFREIELKNLHVFNYATRELLLSNDFKDDLIDHLLYIKCCPPELARNKKDLAKSIDHIGDYFQKSAQCQTNLSDDLKNDREFWNCFILDRYNEFFNVPEHLQQDREFILPLISKQGKLLQYLDPLLRNDFTIVMKAVSQNGLCLEYAPLALRNDHSIVKAATCQNPLALQFVPTELQPEWKEKFLVEMYQDPTKACALLEIFPEEMGNNEQVVLTSAKCHKEYPHAFMFASSKLKRSRDFVLKFIEQGGGLCLAYVPIEFIEDREIVKKAVQQTGQALYFASHKLQQDIELIEIAARQDSTIFPIMAEQLGFKFQVHMYFKHRQPPRLGEIYLQIMRESGNLYPSILASSTKRPSKAALSLFELTLEEYCQVMNEFLPQRMEFAYEGPYFEIPSRFLLNEPVEWLEEQCKPNVTYRTEMWRRYLLEENAPHWSEIFVVHR